MTNVHNTTSAHNDNLTGLSTEAIRVVLETVARVGENQEELGVLLPKMLQGGGLGLLGADAVTQAVRRAGAWSTIDHIEAFLARFQEGELDTDDVRWAWSALAKIRVGEVDGSDESCRLAFEEEWVPREQAAGHWLERCALRLIELALWSGQESVEMSSDDVGLGICNELAAEGREQDARAFVRYLQELGGRPPAKAARQWAKAS